MSDVVFVRERNDEKAWDEHYGCYWYYDGPGQGINPYQGEAPPGALKMRRTTVEELLEENLEKGGLSLDAMLGRGA